MHIHYIYMYISYSQHYLSRLAGGARFELQIFKLYLIIHHNYRHVHCVLLLSILRSPPVDIFIRIYLIETSSSLIVHRIELISVELLANKIVNWILGCLTDIAHILIMFAAYSDDSTIYADRAATFVTHSNFALLLFWLLPLPLLLPLHLNVQWYIQ